MRLWRALLGQKEITRYSLNDYANDLSLAFQGHRYLLGGSASGWSKTEDIEHSFTSYINSVYKSNGIVFAIILARMLLFTEGRFCWFEVGDNGEDGKAAGREGLEVLERPWPNAGTGELLARMEQDVSLGGNFYVAREENRLRRLRPDWVTIVLSNPPAEAVESDVVGYWYHPGRSFTNVEGPGPSDEVYLPDEVGHWSPIPDPDAQYRGMSWLTPVIREVMADKAATEHKLSFFENGAQLGVIISAKENLTNVQFKEWKANFANLHTGTKNAYKPLFLASPVDTSVTTADMRQLDFKVTQGAGETRLCADGGVPPIIVGLSEGLASATYSNYGMARRKFGDHWGRQQWRSASSALSTVVEAPRPDLRLGVNTSGIAFLREDAKDQAEIDQTKASTVSTLVTTGFEPETVKEFIISGDWSVLKHTGLTSVQLVPPGQQSEPTDFGALRDEPLRAIAEVDEDALIARAIAEAIDLVRAKYDVRVPAGNKGGGRFRKLSDRVFEALTDWSNGEGDDDPLDEFTRDQLRKVAKELSDKARAEGDNDRADRLTPRRGASSDEIKLALYKDIRASRRSDKGQSAEAPADSPTPRKLIKFGSAYEAQLLVEKELEKQAKLIADLKSRDLPTNVMLVSRVRGQLARLKLRPVDASGRELSARDINTLPVGYVWKRPGGDIRLDGPVPDGFNERERVEFEGAKQLAAVALGVEREGQTAPGESAPKDALRKTLAPDMRREDLDETFRLLDQINDPAVRDHTIDTLSGNTQFGRPAADRYAINATTPRQKARLLRQNAENDRLVAQDDYEQNPTPENRQRLEKAEADAAALERIATFLSPSDNYTPKDLSTAQAERLLQEQSRFDLPKVAKALGVEVPDGQSKRTTVAKVMKKLSGDPDARAKVEQAIQSLGSRARSSEMAPASGDPGLLTPDELVAIGNLSVAGRPSNAGWVRVGDMAPADRATLEGLAEKGYIQKHTANGVTMFRIDPSPVRTRTPGAGGALVGEVLPPNRPPDQRLSLTKVNRGAIIEGYRNPDGTFSNVPEDGTADPSRVVRIVVQRLDPVDENGEPVQGILRQTHRRIVGHDVTTGQRIESEPVSGGSFWSWVMNPDTETSADIEGELVQRAANGEQLHHYWTKGEGLAKWASSPHPWTALYKHLRKYVGPERAKRMAAQWHKEVLGIWPGEKKGSNPVGPG